MARVVVVSLFPRFYAAGGRAGVVPYPLDQFKTEAGSRASQVRPVPLGGTLPRYPQEGARGTGLEWQPLSTRYLTTCGEAAHVALRVTLMVSITMMTVIYIDIDLDGISASSSGGTRQAAPLPFGSSQLHSASAPPNGRKAWRPFLWAVGGS